MDFSTSFYKINPDLRKLAREFTHVSLQIYSYSLNFWLFAVEYVQKHCKRFINENAISYNKQKPHKETFFSSQ